MINYKLDAGSEVSSWFILLIIGLSIWDLVWRSQALWRSAQLKQKWWFIALLLVNSVGILPLYYMHFVV